MNHQDITLRRGQGRSAASLPRIPGSDGAGVVIKTGKAAGNLKAGDRVCIYPAKGCGCCEWCVTDREFMCAQSRTLGANAPGTYAEYVCVPARNCFPMPTHMTFVEAAALPSAHLAAWRLLVSCAKIIPGSYLLVRAVGSDIANAAMQIGAQLGCHVIVTADADDKLQRAIQFGAEHGVNDGDAEFAREVRKHTAKRGVDVVVDCSGGSGWVKSLACLARGGCLVTTDAITDAKPPTDLRRIFWNHLRIFGSSLGSRAEFQQVLNFTKATRMKPIVDQVFALKDAALAHQRWEQAAAFGKIVLQMPSGFSMTSRLD